MRKVLVFVMDPMAKVAIHKDTSFALMLEAQGRGYTILHVHPRDIDLVGSHVFLHASELFVQRKEGEHFRVLQNRRIAAEDCHTIFIRTDPPFDQNYLTATWLLSFAERAGVRIINGPTAIRSANEKLYALEFAQFCPRTLVSSNRQQLFEFLAELDHNAVLKPLNGHGGFGVFRLRAGDTNSSALLDVLTQEGRQPVLLQEFVESNDDKRLFFVDGQLMGALARIVAPGDHRSNIHVGGRAQLATIDANDKTLAATLGPRLRKDGLFFVGVDVMGDKLLEINVTSPTLVQELKREGGPDLAAVVLDHLE